MAFSAAFKQLFPGKPNWSANQLPDLSTKVALVTGGNAGIGRETVKRLLMKNAKVYLAGRSQERAERAIGELREETGRTALFLQLDLADLQSVKRASEEYKRRESQLDALVLNAGVVYPPAEHQFTTQGYDATFGTNVIGHFLLHRLLYTVVAASGRESDFARIVWLSSSASQYPRALDYEAFRDGPAHAKVHPFIMYAQSKVAAIMLSMRLARHCAVDNVVSIAVDPGSIKSEIYRSSPWHIRTTDWMYSYPVEYGAVGPLYAAGSPEAADYNGKYLKPWAVLAQPNPFALDVQEQDKLWTWLEEQVHGRESQLDVLILNAGVLFPSPDALTAQGYDATFGVNIVGHFLLHRLLYPLLSASGRESDPSRVIWLSSMASYKPHRITYDAFREGPVRRRMDPFDLYSESKVGAVMLSTYLAKTCAADNVASIAVDPGYIKSEIYRSSPWYLKLFDWFLNFPVEYGAIGSLYAGAAPEGAGLNGKYLKPWAQVVPPSPFSLDGKEQEKLWTWLEDQVQAYL